VTEIAVILNELTAVAAGVEKARNDAATACTVTEEEIRRTTAADWNASTEALSEVLEAVGRVESHLATVTVCINDAATCVDTGRTLPSLLDILANIIPAIDRLSAARDNIVAAIGQIDRAKTRVMRAKGGRPEHITTALDAVRTTLVSLGQRGGTVKQRVAAHINRLRNIGNPNANRQR
jgi:hypothetical protein